LEAVAALYDEFTCTGVRIKFFQIPQNGINSLNYSEIIEDNNSIFKPTDVYTAPMSVYGNY